jgi:hypothetical protein
MFFHSLRITAFFTPGGEMGGKKTIFRIAKNDILIVLTI